MTHEIGFVMENLFTPKFSAKLARYGMANGGMLLYGPPGTGKTCLAHAIESVWRRADPNLVAKTVKGPELFSELVGKTEENVRGLFKDSEANLNSGEALQ